MRSLIDLYETIDGAREELRQKSSWPDEMMTPAMYAMKKAIEHIDEARRMLAPHVIADMKASKDS